MNNRFAAFVIPC